MKLHAGLLWISVILPGLAATAVSAYYLFPEWTALDASYRNFEKISQSPNPKLEDLYIAQAAENRHRINCFAEGVGALMGLTISAIGIHGLCVLKSGDRPNA
jgi:hypothetical protein